MKKMMGFIFLSALFLMSTAAFAKKSKLYDLSCKKDERATGCIAPFAQCDFGVEADIVDTCRLSAADQLCPDFGWEKCCATNCFLRADKKMSKMGKCMEECLASPLSNVYWPKKIKKSR